MPDFLRCAAIPRSRSASVTRRARFSSMVARLPAPPCPNRTLRGRVAVGSGSSAVTHGFTWRPGYGFRTVDDSHGQGTTTINGVNDAGDLVGFYTDSAGNTDGMLALP